MESGFLKLVVAIWGDICFTYTVRKAKLSGKDLHLEEKENVIETLRKVQSQEAKEQKKKKKIGGNTTSKELGDIQYKSN